MARIKEAFRLNENDAETLVAELWPHNVFPWELWGKAYDTFWRGVAASNAEMFKLNNPPYPEMTGIWADAHVNAWCEKMYVFFSELAFALPANSVQKGLNYILEETYEDSSRIFSAEREALFTNLLEAERGFDWSGFHHIDTEKLDEMLNDKAFRIPKNSYHFISRLLRESLVVDKLAAVRHLLLCEYPFDHEVKGLTRHFVERIKTALAAEHPLVLDIVAQESNTPGSPHESLTSSMLGAAPSVAQTETNEDAILIPRALWEKKKPQQVCDDMRVAGYTDDAPIAHALYYWVGIKILTEIGTILRGEDISDSARHKYARKKLKEAEGRYRTE
ncbi:hypothetical protein [Desulfovibrio porci]|uniref:hypothetical protein n=1 Tax=Desulfovibrio porci TaxID=2605782 RepID=UPI003A952ADF